ncbi:hypothetical protein [Actinomyces procaprae]|uniref:hypothetical protein n=1 Tax=Actinomyces procaprae TaxID=2560010 RepID=UPI00109DFCE5|nr:hypothetical protein [Actinomyces procaprae]
MTTDRAEDSSSSVDLEETRSSLVAEPDDAELALMLATATGMGRAQLRELIERRAREREAGN